jgi:hypothetical protein
MGDLQKAKTVALGSQVILREFRRLKDLRGSKMASTASQILRKLRMTAARPSLMRFFIMAFEDVAAEVVF